VSEFQQVETRISDKPATIFTDDFYDSTHIVRKHIS